MNSRPPFASADDQASLWAAKLDGAVLSTEDRVALDRWLATDPSHRVLLSAYCQFSADLEKQLPLLAGIRDGIAENRTAPQTPRSLPWLRRPLWAAAALTAAAAVAVLLIRHEHAAVPTQTLATSVAQRQTVTLADGSRAELNARTALAIEFAADERRVRLAGGEAFFQVTRDPRRPFVVETPAGSVRVTGTEFNVRTADAASLEVTVREGSVAVRAGDDLAPRHLHAGDQLVRHHRQVSVAPLSEPALYAALAWRRGQVIFEDTPLRDALLHFARYHGRNLQVSDAASDKRIGGAYALDDLSGFLENLEIAVPGVRALRASDGSVVVDIVHP